MTDSTLAEEELKVFCKSTVGCNTTGDDEIGLMTVRECCMGTPDGLAYTMSSKQPGNDTCTPCIGELAHALYQILQTVLMMFVFSIPNNSVWFLARVICWS